MTLAIYIYMIQRYFRPTLFVRIDQSSIS